MGGAAGERRREKPRGDVSGKTRREKRTRKFSGCQYWSEE